MRHVFTLIAVGLGLAGCGNTNHPEYHPVTTLSYSQNINQPLHVGATSGQPVYVMPAGAQTTVFPGPPPPPQPPPDFPW